MANIIPLQGPNQALQTEKPKPVYTRIERTLAGKWALHIEADDTPAHLIYFFETERLAEEAQVPLALRFAETRRQGKP